MAINYKQANTASMYDQTTGAYIGQLGLQGQQNLTGVYSLDSNGNVNGLLGPDGSLLSKGWALRASMESALKSNAILGAPLAPAPTWQASTVYLYGQCVRGVAGGSTNNVYMCCGNTTNNGGSQVGTSAASGGPTSTGSALITDNTAVWMYVGPARATGSYPLYSTVNPTTSTDVMNGYLGFVNCNNYTAMGLTVQYNTYVAASPVVSINNCNLSDSVTIIPKNSGTAASPTRSSSNIKYAARFVTNAKKWVALGGNPLYQYSNVIRQIKINGQFISESVSVSFTGTLINPGAVILDLSSFPAGNKTIEIFGINNFTDLVSQIAVQPGEYVYPLSSNNGVKIAIEGDSITDMTYLSDTDWFARIEVALNEYLGCQNILNNSIGGTGLISNNSNTVTTYIQRLADIVLFKPDILIINGAHNDDSYGQAARQAAMLAYLQAARAALPACSIIIVGGNLLSGDGASQLTVEQDWQTVFNQWADKNAYFIPVLSNSPALLQNQASAPYFYKNTGSPSWASNGHPVGWYYYHMNRLIADGVRKFLSNR